MRKILYAFLALVAVLIVGLLVGPSFFDWNNYKPQIASAVKEVLGRELRIVGDIQISILPSPALSVKRVSLDNIAGADNREMVAFEEVEVNVDVSSLLQGKIAVKSVRLVRPVISLEITKDGRASWILSCRVTTRPHRLQRRQQRLLDLLAASAWMSRSKV